MIVNSPSMPMKPSGVEIYDTSAEYSLERVSYGGGYSGWGNNRPLINGTSLEFDANKLSTAK